ncbi:unnamed protein product [Closterium sp. NIES-64]|nr:unnamed protein product [Closterium sp. NIES-64]
MRPGAVHQQPDEEEDGEEEEEDGEEGEEREEGEGNSEQYSRTRSKGPEGEEICRVLGGGVVLGSLVLVSGSPGAGKSTLLLQLAGLLAEEARGSLTGGSPLAVLYVSGEEREEQLATRAKRLGITADNLFLLSENNLESILEGITEIEPRAVIVDSIQTMHLPGVTGSLGSVSQVRECTLLLLLEAKNRGIPIFIVSQAVSDNSQRYIVSPAHSHIAMSLFAPSLLFLPACCCCYPGDVAGPRDLKHIVDVVMHVEVSVTVTGPRDLKHIVDVVMHVEVGESECNWCLVGSDTGKYGRVAVSRDLKHVVDVVIRVEMAACGMVPLLHPSLAFP